MNAGELRNRIQLLRLTPVEDGEGGHADTYPPYATVWAKIAPVTQRNNDLYDQTQSELTHKITIRYRGDVLPTDRVQYGARLFEQDGPPVNVKECNAYLTLLCREVFDNGA